MKEEGIAKKVHSLIDKVYQPRNLELAWEKVKANAGSRGIDQVSISAFEAVSQTELTRLHQELKEQTYKPLARTNFTTTQDQEATKQNEYLCSSYRKIR
jgi:RNA-directed DNA polymerase